MSDQKISEIELKILELMMLIQYEHQMLGKG